MLNIRSKNFPRLYASFLLNILNQYSEKYVDRDRKPNQEGSNNRDGYR